MLPGTRHGCHRRPTNKWETAQWRMAAPHGTVWCMATPITVNIPHQLGQAEARSRIEAGFTKVIGQLPGIGGVSSQSWHGNRLTFSVVAMGQTVAGVLDVGDAIVSMEIELTGVLGLIASRLKGQLQKAGQKLLTKK